MKLNKLNNNVLVFDVDGTLVRYNFPTLGVKCFEPHEWIQLNARDNMYKHYIEKTNLFDEVIANNLEHVYTLSAALTSYEQNNKIEFINSTWKIEKEHILFVSELQYKIDMLKILRDKYNSKGDSTKDIILIEDDSSVMMQIEQARLHGIHCYLVSDFV